MFVAVGGWFTRELFYANHVMGSDGHRLCRSDGVWPRTSNFLDLPPSLVRPDCSLCSLALRTLPCRPSRLIEFDDV